MITRKGIIFPSRHIGFILHLEIVKLWITRISTDLSVTNFKKIIPSISPEMEDSKEEN